MTAFDYLLAGYRTCSALEASTTATVPSAATALIVAVTSGGKVPAGIVAATPAELEALGFTGERGQELALGGSPVVVLVGIGEQSPGEQAGAAEDCLRDAVALGSRRVGKHQALAVLFQDTIALTDSMAVAAVEGAVLARYRFDALRAVPAGTPVESLTLVVGDAAGGPAFEAAVAKGRTRAAATVLARDLANTPHNHMNATVFAQIAETLGAEAGLEVAVWDKADIVREQLGGVLAINAGSHEEPRVVRLRYTPAGEPSGNLAMVGKGIMYDSGGIGLKPNNDSHAQMKNDMSGAANILAAMLTLGNIGGSAEVTGYLMCTDNMPSATATALGDIIKIRGGRGVEIIDTDAEGRIVLADGIMLALEQKPDAIVDMATLTGSVMRALGSEIGGTMGSDQALVDRLRAAGEATGEPLWQLPLAHVYRKHLDSPSADMRNVAPPGIPDGLIAALFIHSFTEGVPWGHIDIAGTAWSNSEGGWHAEGCTGFGTRLLSEFAGGFTK